MRFFSIKNLLQNVGGLELPFNLDGSRFLNSLLGKVISAVVVLIAGIFTVYRAKRLTVVLSVVEYDISNRLPLKQIKSDHIDMDMQPYVY